VDFGHSIAFSATEMTNFPETQMTIAQIVYDNERSFGYDDEDIHNKVRLI
jgi:hypothetical protein